MFGVTVPQVVVVVVVAVIILMTLIIVARIIWPGGGPRDPEPPE
jgi:hypothetical protein